MSDIEKYTSAGMPTVVWFLFAAIAAYKAVQVYIKINRLLSKSVEKTAVTVDDNANTNANANATADAAIAAIKAGQAKRKKSAPTPATPPTAPTPPAPTPAPAAMAAPAPAPIEDDGYWESLASDCGWEQDDGCGFSQDYYDLG